MGFKYTDDELAARARHKTAWHLAKVELVGLAIQASYQLRRTQEPITCDAIVEHVRGQLNEAAMRQLNKQEA